MQARPVGMGHQVWDYMLISLIYGVSKAGIQSAGGGGPGGRGGCSHSWTETTYVTDSVGDRVARHTTYNKPGKFCKVAMILLFQSY